MTGTERMAILVVGMVAGVPGLGGAAWAVLQYLLGLRSLGHRVCLIEPLEREIDPATERYFRSVAARFGLEGSSALLETGTRRTVGLTYSDLRGAARDADLLLNIAGMLEDEALLEPIPVRVYMDLDPGFTQLWQASEGIDMRLAGHTHFATVGGALGTPDCPIPTCGVAWIPTLPPVALDEWPRARRMRRNAFTTVAHWRGYGSIEYQGVRYGQKAHALRPLIGLPGRSRERFQLALAIDPGEEDDVRALRSHGWELADPSRVAGTPDRYRAWIRGSRAEFGIAKSGYVAGHTGWFSDRSVCYLASGRPVLAQETGFSSFLPTGRGLFSFRTEEDVMVAAEAIRSDYGSHADAARELAEASFDARRVLPLLLDSVGGRA